MCLDYYKKLFLFAPNLKWSQTIFRLYECKINLTIAFRYTLLRSDCSPERMRRSFGTRRLLPHFAIRHRLSATCRLHSASIVLLFRFLLVTKENEKIFKIKIYFWKTFMPKKTHIYKVDFCFLTVKPFVETQGFGTDPIKGHTEKAAI